MSTPTAGVELGHGLDGIESSWFNTIPYVSEPFYEAETALWRDAWILAGRAADLAAQGDFITFDLKPVHTSVFIVNTGDGDLQGFRNLCTHRGCRLLSVRGNRGHVTRIRCRFHAWLFDIKGRLRAIPHEELFPHVDKARKSLLGVSVGVWGGFVFFNLAESPSYTLEQWLAGLPPALGPLLERDWHWYAGYKAVCDANWKELLHGVHDGYHAGALHANSTPGARWFKPGDLRNSVFPESPGVSSLLSVYQPRVPEGIEEAVLLSPVQRLGIKYTGRTLFTKSDGGNDHAHSGAVNPLGTDNWVFDMWTIFPNQVLVLMRNVFFVFRYFPIGPHRTVWDYSFFYQGKCWRFSDLFCRELGVVDVRNLLPEDMKVAREVHENLRSGVLGYSAVARDMEACIMDFYHKLLAKLEIEEERLGEFA